jgi:hypothetical protein
MMHKKQSISKADITQNNMLIYKLVNKSNNFSSQFKSIIISYFRYTPILTDLDTKLKAFIPDYIPAVG